MLRQGYGIEIMSRLKANFLPPCVAFPILFSTIILTGSLDCNILLCNKKSQPSTADLLFSFK